MCTPKPHLHGTASRLISSPLPTNLRPMSQEAPTFGTHSQDIDALHTIQPSGPIKSVIAWLLLNTYERRLRAIMATALA